jgi:PAS domain S-box-containing protein
VFGFLEKLDPAEASYWKNTFSKALSGNSLKFEKEFKVDSFHRYSAFSINPIWENKSIIGLSCFAHDITEQKLAQQSLEASEANIKSIFENTHVAYVLLNPAFLIVSLNKFAAVTLGKQLGKPLKVGNNLLDYVHAGRRPAVEAQFHKVLSGENINYQTLHSGEVSTWYDVQLSPVFDTAKNVLGIVVATVDITEKKESEIQWEKITADLIQRNKDLEQFAYIVSHNFRAPVANILGICNVLQYPNQTPEEKSEIEKAISLSALKLDEVIIDLNNILQVKHEVNEKKEEVIFSELVSDIKNSIGSLLAQEEIAILTDFSEIDKLLILKSYLYSIFYNLLSNSIKYRRSDIKSVIEIKSFKNKNAVELVFKDNGRGIDLKRHSEKIFGLYKRFHDLEIEGKGMGLFMVKTQVETLGGKISVTSAINEGAEFKIHFKL